MLLSVRHTYGTVVEAADGKLGSLCDWLFDDRTWRVQSLVLDAGTWLRSRRLTIPPHILVKKNWADHQLSLTAITRQEVLHSPGSETHIPLGGTAGLEEATMVDWDIYWIDVLPHPWQVSGDSHIHNTQEVSGYHIEGPDGPLGHVADFLINDIDWTLRYVAIDTRDWWPGKYAVIPINHVEAIVGEERIIRVSLSREAVEQSHHSVHAPLAST